MVSMIKEFIAKLSGQYMINGVYMGKKRFEIINQTKLDLAKEYKDWSVKEILDEAMKYRIIAESSIKAEQSEMVDGERESNKKANIVASTYAICLSQIGKEKFAEAYTYIR